MNIADTGKVNFVHNLFSFRVTREKRLCMILVIPSLMALKKWINSVCVCVFVCACVHACLFVHICVSYEMIKLCTNSLSCWGLESIEPSWHSVCLCTQLHPFLTTPPFPSNSVEYTPFNCLATKYEPIVLVLVDSAWLSGKLRLLLVVYSTIQLLSSTYIEKLLLKDSLLWSGN